MTSFISAAEFLPVGAISLCFSRIQVPIKRGQVHPKFDELTYPYQLYFACSQSFTLFPTKPNPSYLLPRHVLSGR